VLHISLAVGSSTITVSSRGWGLGIIHFGILQGQHANYLI
jgi:hypothetical protein